MTRRRLLRELRWVGRGWCVLVAAGATIGGIVGWVTWEHDRS